MVKFGELLMIIGSILIIAATVMFNLTVGLIVSGFISFMWGLFLLKIASMNPTSKGGDER